jgi:hypothetical protein
MGLLVRTAAALALGGGCIGGSLTACEWVVPPDNDFNAQGVTSLVFYATSGTPSHLVSAGDSLFFAHGPSLYQVAKTGGGDPQAVRSLDAPIRSLAFDGQRSIAYCDENGTLDTLDTGTLGRIAGVPSSVAAGCADVAIDAEGLVYTAGLDPSDAAAFQSVNLIALPDGGARTLSGLLAPDGGVDLTTASVAISNQAVFVMVPPMLQTTGPRGDSCRLVRAGFPSQSKVLAFPSPDGGPSIVFRSSGDALKHLDLRDPIEDKACCSQGSVCVGPAPIADPGTPSDFTVHDGFVYWSQNGTVTRRQLLPGDGTLKSADAGASDETVVTLSGDGVSIPELVVDDTYAFVVVGTRILRVPLP